MANWYYMAFILIVAVLHIVNNLAVPVSFGHAKSYSLFAGQYLLFRSVVRRSARAAEGEAADAEARAAA